jgi:hypothetical protein
MLRRLLAVVLVLGLLAGGLLAADGTVVSYDKKTMKLVVKVGEKERTIQLNKKSHVHDAKGKHLKVKDFGKHLKKGVKVELEEEDGKVTEITIKGKK